jgi:hypothetical protein
VSSAAASATRPARRGGSLPALLVLGATCAVAVVGAGVTHTSARDGARPRVQGLPLASALASARRQSALVTQVRSPWLTDGPRESLDCGPAAMASALRLLGLDVPGTAGLHDRRLLARARELATGTAAGTASLDGAYTYLPQLARLARAAGARTSTTADVATMLAWSRAGDPVVVQGAPLRAWDARLPPSVVRHVTGGHYVTLAGPVPGRPGRWWLLEPLGVRGPIAVTTAEIGRFVRDWNGAALRVTAA